MIQSSIIMKYKGKIFTRRIEMEGKNKEQASWKLRRVGTDEVGLQEKQARGRSWRRSEEVIVSL